MTAGWVHLVLAVSYAIGWALSTRGSLRRRMLIGVCTHCHESSCGHRYGVASRGLLRARNGGDVGVAAFCAAFWPIRLAGLFIGGVFAAWGRGMRFLVFAATPLTDPERERVAREQADRIAEQEAEIARLTAQIEGTSS